MPHISRTAKFSPDDPPPQFSVAGFFPGPSRGPRRSSSNQTCVVPS